MLTQLEEDQSIVQLMNVASLPGIYRYALGMPDWWPAPVRWWLLRGEKPCKKLCGRFPGLLSIPTSQKPCGRYSSIAQKRYNG